MLSKNQVKEIQALHLKKQRDLRGLFIAEGAKTVEEIISERADILTEIFATADFLKKNTSTLSKLGTKHTEVTEEELKKISLQASPNQVLAVCNYFESGYTEDQPPFALFLDDIRDPGNFGTILRLCDWFGFRTIYCSPYSCDKYNPKVIQSTMGAFLRVRVVYTEMYDLAPKFENIYGAVLSGNSIYQEKLNQGLLVIGNEANGISENTMGFISKPITIPAGNAGGSESLNAAVAAAIMTGEFFRQLTE